MILTTERLLLREFVEDDWRAVQAYQSDPRYLHFASVLNVDSVPSPANEIRHERGEHSRGYHRDNTS